MQVVSARFDVPNACDIKVAMEHGAYKEIEKYKDKARILAELEKSGLRGKGGGGGVTFTKWKNMLNYADKTAATRTYLVVNGDESEPGTCKDKYILNLDPHLLIEGMILSAHALGAKQGYVYIRGEYEREFQSLNKAVDEAKQAGILGDFEIIIYKGAGAYICGEKTALLESIEGKRGHPRLKPHDKAEPDKLFGYPCVVNNVETIASLPFIVKNGGEMYRSVGTEKSPGTLLFQISGHVNNPCVKEMPFGTKMLDFINEIGGGVKGGKKLKAVIPGGASAAVMSASEVEKATLDYENISTFKSTLGTGGMIVMDESVSMPKVLLNLLEFYTEESCGQCTPCREGCGWALRIVEKFVNKTAKQSDFDTLKDICFMMDGKTVCVFAPAVKDAIVGMITKFEDEFRACIKDA